MSEVDFVCGCPVDGCKNSKERFTWVHSGCGGYERLSEYGILRCVRCGRSSELVNWRFNCGAHDFLPASLQGLLSAFSIMGGLQGISMTFLTNLNQSVLNQFKR